MIIPAGFGQATLLFTGAAVPTGAAITFGFENAGGLSASAAGVAVRTAVTSSSLMSRLAPTLSLTTIRTKLGPNATGPQADTSTTLVGGSPGETWPNAAVLLSKYTAFGGRKSRGRMFLPGVIEADVQNGGVLTSTALGAFSTQFGNLLTALSTGGISMVLLHNDPAVVPYPVTGFGVSSVLATQRRRIRR